MADDSNLETTIENRVYLFKDLASAWIAANPGAFRSERQASFEALADIAYICCVFADEEEAEAEEVAEEIRNGSTDE